MGITGSEARKDFEEVLAYGQPSRIKYYDTSYGAGSYYDDDVTLTLSGTTWITGLVQPVTAGRGSSEAVLVQQGQLLTNDSKIYVTGTVDTSGIIKIGLGSPSINEYSVVGDGITSWNINGEIIYKKIFVRLLTNGSLVGE